MHVVLIEFRTSTPYPVQLANALGKLCRVTLMLPDTALKFADRVNKESVTLEFFHMPHLRSVANLTMVRHLYHRIKALQADLVHVTFWHLWATPGLGMIKNFPLVVTVHDVERHPGERGVWAIPTIIYPLQWRRADQIIVHATTARQQILARYGRKPKNVNVVPIGSYDFYRAFPGSVQSEQPNTVLFFGRIWGYKGLKYLIEAEPLITRAVPDARIVIAGHGEPIAKYQRLMVNPDHFEIHNYRIPDAEVAGFFQRASVVALPYTEASQSGVVSVAYAFGKPVVATRVGGLPDVVIDGKTGFLVPPADAHSLADAIIALLQDTSLRKDMGKGAQQFAETELSWQRIAQKTLQVYQKVI